MGLSTSAVTRGDNTPISIEAHQAAYIVISTDRASTVARDDAAPVVTHEAAN